MLPEPTIIEFLDAAAAGVHGSADGAADYLRGSDYEVLSGPCAVIWSQEAQRDTDLFRAIRFNDAEDDQLTEMMLARYGAVRFLDSRGTGRVTLTRPTTTAGGGTIWQGTRIGLAGGPTGTTAYYRTTADTTVAPSDVFIELAIEAVETGPSSKANATTGLFFDDPLWDPSWVVTALDCGPGTVFEPAAEFRARVQRERLSSRVGHPQKLIDTCKLAGAANVAIFRSDYGGDATDGGLNYCYVGDPGYSATPDLLRACTKALRGARVLGDHLQVLPMRRQVVDVEAQVTLNVSPTLVDTSRLYRIHAAAVAQYFGGLAGRWAYSRVGLYSALARPTPEVQSVTFSSPASDATILSGGTMPAVLNRYIQGKISIVYQAP